MVFSPSPSLPPDDLEYILRHGETLWQEVADARFFITGGTGFFGIWLLETLAFVRKRLNLRFSVSLLSRDVERFSRRFPHLAAHPAFAFVQGDVRDFRFPEGRFSHVIHAAAASAAPQPPAEVFSVLVDGTRHVLAFARAAQAARFLFVSSGAVYGAQPPEMTCIPETTCCAPDPATSESVYSEGKRAAELACAITAAACPEMTCVIARCFAFIGPHLPLNAHFAAGNLLRDALSERVLRIKGDGRTVRSYLYMADLVVWLLTLLIRGQSLRPYNVGSDEAVDIAALARRIRDALAPASSIEIAQPAGTALPPRYVPDLERARSELGLEVRIGLDEAIARTARWLRETTA
ncbi:MAG: NAD(P)-dependent oxidoreductase [Zoogloeaceae bacterium]|jgi:dTDP-glucose 4,6-dehydratase|nr:NAD(P)-dependent oxidoreductase [Zoogloeaceae bacterium]